MIEAMKSDVGMGPAGGFAGGITIYNNHSSYNYPCGTLGEHQRALVIHENLHMLQMIVHGGRSPVRGEFRLGFLGEAERPRYIGRGLPAQDEAHHVAFG